MAISLALSSSKFMLLEGLSHTSKSACKLAITPYLPDFHSFLFFINTITYNERNVQVQCSYSHIHCTEHLVQRGFQSCPTS